MFILLGWYEAASDNFYPYARRELNEEQVMRAVHRGTSQGDIEFVQLSTGRIKVWFTDDQTAEYPDFETALTAVKLRS